MPASQDTLSRVSTIQQLTHLILKSSNLHRLTL